MEVDVNSTWKRWQTQQTRSSLLVRHQRSAQCNGPLETRRGPRPGFLDGGHTVGHPLLAIVPDSNKQQASSNHATISFWLGLGLWLGIGPQTLWLNAIERNWRTQFSVLEAAD